MVSIQGGPTYYKQKGLGGEKKLPFWKLFAVLFGGCIFMTWFITLQNYTVSEAVGSTFHLPYIVPSLLYVAAIYLIIIGGVKKVGVISSYMTPIMCMLYIVGSLAILVVNFGQAAGNFWTDLQGGIYKHRRSRRIYGSRCCNSNASWICPFRIQQRGRLGNISHDPCFRKDRPSCKTGTDGSI